MPDGSRNSDQESDLPQEFDPSSQKTRSRTLSNSSSTPSLASAATSPSFTPDETSLTQELLAELRKILNGGKYYVSDGKKCGRPLDFAARSNRLVDLLESRLQPINTDMTETAAHAGTSTQTGQAISSSNGKDISQSSFSMDDYASHSKTPPSNIRRNGKHTERQEDQRAASTPPISIHRNSVSRIPEGNPPEKTH
ncbi:hypothetical protein AVEN_180551-1 [Araneus ventricosus]|uniref:Uncharacterized protein n=1 Tax=Araneus ventricosus TaxID=182803 RepID=A0A4Y2FLL0_ARAVE|nr:hypothetical protein AVEN_180551-1 [Araneus ventricosus]